MRVTRRREERTSVGGGGRETFQENRRDHRGVSEGPRTSRRPLSPLPKRESTWEFPRPGVHVMSFSSEVWRRGGWSTSPVTRLSDPTLISTVSEQGAYSTPPMSLSDRNGRVLLDRGTVPEVRCEPRSVRCPSGRDSRV